MTIALGTAAASRSKASASLRFDGTGVRLDGLEIAKGEGSVSGAAFIGWDSTYSFNATGRRLAVEQFTAIAYPRAPLAGVTEFTAAGSGTLDAPRYDVKFRVIDLIVANEDVGQMTGTLALRGKELSGEIDIASPHLAVTGTGRIALTPQADAELTFRSDSMLDRTCACSCEAAAMRPRSRRIGRIVGNWRTSITCSSAAPSTAGDRLFDYGITTPRRFA